MTRFPFHKASEGFTLVEVMLAVLIVSMALAVLLSAATRGVGIAKKAQEYETARRLHAELAFREPIQIDDLDAGRDSGRFDSPYQHVEWERVIEEYGEEEDKLFLVSTTVRWPSFRGKMIQEKTTTLIHEPTALRAKWIDDTATGDR